MKFSKLSLAIALSSLSYIGVQAATLTQVYQDAVNSDPTFKQARAQWMKDREATPIARSKLLTDVDISSSWLRNHNNLSGSANQATYTLDVTQPLFNFQAWNGLAEARASVKASAAAFNDAAQDLIVRTTQAYFDVLIATSQLQYDVAEKRDYLEQLKTAREQYKVGLKAITPLYDAEASYDAAVATEISDRNDLSNKIEALRAITGHTYSSLMGLHKQVPLLPIVPNNIGTWVNTATRQNYSLIAQHFTTLASFRDIRTQSAARLPVFSLEGNLAHSNGSQVSAGAVARNTNFIGVNMDFPIFSGGATFAETSQARYQYGVDYAKFEGAYRTLVNDTRTSFLDITSGKRKIQADAQSVLSNEKKVETTQASYTVGTSTMVDLLEAFKGLYQAKSDYTKAQYDYIQDMLQLRYDAGTLGVEDLRRVDGWLKQRVTFKPTKGGDYSYRYNSIAKTSNKDKYSRYSKATTATTTSKQTHHSEHLSYTKAYAIQLFAAKDKSHAQQFLNLQPHNLDLRIVSSNVNGTTWYKVVSGNYATKTEAAQALKDAPQLHKFHAWVSDISVVKKPTSTTFSNNSFKIQPAQQLSQSPAPQAQQQVMQTNNNYKTTTQQQIKKNNFTVTTPDSTAVNLPEPGAEAIPNNTSGGTTQQQAATISSNAIQQQESTSNTGMQQQTAVANTLQQQNNGSQNTNSGAASSSMPLPGNRNT